MEKKKYYVAVTGGSGEIMADKTAFPFEFEIEATDHDVYILQDLFEEKEVAEDNNALRGLFAPFKFTRDDENARYDASLERIYKKIHELGTEDTKRHIEQMGVLTQGIQKDDYH